MSFLKNMEEKFPFSLIGVILAVIFGVLAVYTAFFYTKSPNLRLEILNNSRVYDIKENVDDLEILFKNENIRSKNLTLSLVNLKFSNPSDVAIQKSFFDEERPLGVKLDDSQIIKCEMSLASELYIKEALRTTVLNTDTVIVSPVILDPGAFFTLKILVLHPEKSLPHPKVIGKIAGIKKIDIVDYSVLPAKKSFWKYSYEGNFFVQLTRILSYGVGFIVLLIGIGVFGEKIDAAIRKMRRSSLVKKFKKGFDSIVEGKTEMLFNKYIEEGEYCIVGMEKLLLNPQRIKRGLEVMESSKNKSKNNSKMEYYWPHHSEEKLAEYLLSVKVIAKEGGSLNTDEEVARNIKSFVLFLTTVVPVEIKKAKRYFAFEKSKRI